MNPLDVKKDGSYAYEGEKGRFPVRAMEAPLPSGHVWVQNPRGEDYIVHCDELKDWLQHPKASA